MPLPANESPFSLCRTDRVPHLATTSASGTCGAQPVHDKIQNIPSTVMVPGVTWGHVPKENEVSEMLTPVFKEHPDQEVDTPGRQSTTLSFQSDMKHENIDFLPHTSCSESQPVSSLSDVRDSDPGAGRQLQPTVSSSSSPPPLD